MDNSIDTIEHDQRRRECNFIQRGFSEFMFLPIRAMLPSRIL